MCTYNRHVLGTGSVLEGHILKNSGSGVMGCMLYSAVSVIATHLFQILLVVSIVAERVVQIGNSSSSECSLHGGLSIDRHVFQRASSVLVACAV